MGKLNFRWLIDGEVAGHKAPGSEEDLYYLKELGIEALVRMVEDHVANVSCAQVEKVGLIDCHEPVLESAAPSQVQIDKIITFIKRSVAEGKPVGVSCRAGIGRTGTILACYLVSKCHTAVQAIEEVRNMRPGSIITEDQEKAVYMYADRVGESQV
jgi:atypical dual specificity phosphatase